MTAFSKLSQRQRTLLMKKAIKYGVDFFLNVDRATAEYPTGYGDKPSGNWWKFGFSAFYVTDLLQTSSPGVTRIWP
jgi:hypothetical protein